MKALVYTQPNEVQLLDRPEPQLEPGEVVLEIEAVGICGSDMHAYHGHDPRRKPGLILGHEFCGKIVQSAAPGFSVGQRVTGNPLITCGTCDWTNTIDSSGRMPAASQSSAISSVFCFRSCVVSTVVSA